jgi:hypothetical protein
MPTSGRNANSQRAERSTIASVTAVSPTNSTITGPLSITPAAIAVQKIAGRIQEARASRCWRCSGR